MANSATMLATEDVYATKISKQLESLHYRMVNDVANYISPDLDKSDWDVFVGSLHSLLEKNFLERKDINFIQICTELIKKEHIYYGSYTTLYEAVKKIDARAAKIIQATADEIQAIQLEEEMVIFMYQQIYAIQEGSLAVFIECEVDPKPNSILWKRGKSTPPREKVLIDNRKYFSGSKEAPSLVIRNPEKLVDEAYYQCMARANGKIKNGDIVQLQVSDDKQGSSRANPTITSHSSMTTHEPTQQTQELPAIKPDFMKSRRGQTKRERKDVSDDSDDEWNPTSERRKSQRARLASTDQGSQMSFKIKEDIDLNREKSKEDVSVVFSRVTHTEERTTKVEYETGSVIICIDISPASNSSEPSSIHLAEEFKHYLLDGGTIQLTDESHTVLHVDEEACFKIAPQNAAEDGFPYVNISHGEFTVPVEKTAFIQAYVIASPEAMSIQWYKVENDERIPIEIDNERYFAGSTLSPTLIIRETNTDDQGQYQCSATNSNGTGWSNISVLSIQPGEPQRTSSQKRKTEASLSSPDDRGYQIRMLYHQMVLHLSERFSPNLKLIWQRLLVVLRPLLPEAFLGDDITNFGQICENLSREGKIHPMRGSFKKLHDAVKKIDADSAKVVEETSVQIKELLSEGRDPKLAAMIDTTKSIIQTEKESYQFIPTKSLQDAHQKLLENKIVIIQGNTGDGKSAIAFKLLRLLCCDEEEEQQNRYRQPLQLHNIKDFDLVAPKSQLVMYVDNIFGENYVCQEDVKEWEKREKEIIAKCCGNEREANYLVITICSGISNSVNGLKKTFTKQNIVDLSQYKDQNEKLELLRLYQPKTKFVKWMDVEEKQIVASAPDIGFPLCCRLFRDTPTLQTERVKFFERPFHYLKSSLSKLKGGTFIGLLYLFLNGGTVKEVDLDISFEKSEVSEKMNAAFSFDVMKVFEPFYYKRNKAIFVKESLESLLGGHVKKENTEKQGNGSPCYKFSSVAIEESMALLYGETTPIGFIQNCPKKFLSYVTTAKNTPNRIVLSSDDQINAMFKRLFREYESDPNSGLHSDVWTDILFLRQFIHWIDGKSINSQWSFQMKQMLLNRVCSSGSEDCVEFLLSVGVTPDNETLFSVVKGGSVQLLSALTKYDIIPTARACRSRSSHYKYYTYNINVLHEACLLEREDMVTMLCDTYPHLVHDTNYWRQSSLHLAARTGNCGIFQIVERTVLKSLCRVEDVQHKCESEDGHVVHRSCVCGQYMSQLVDESGRTVLHWSCREGHREFSLELGKTYPALTTAVDKDGNTILHVSCKYGHRELSLELFKCYPALTTNVDKDGRTILHASCIGGHTELSLELCKLHQEQTTAVDNDGMTILHLSCMWGRKELSLELCKLQQAQISAQDNYGRTLLHVSCMWGHRELSLELCKLFPALTTAVDNEGCHCLHHIAGETSDIDMFTNCELYVKQYVKTTGGKYDITTMRTKNGESVLDLAKKRTKRLRGMGELHINNPLYDHLVKLFTSELGPGTGQD
ncbi:uncharacterized protein LOC117343099 [Pecten maximus]|uniref:uncharacterized protein LOC117343099 n=1 Tax=Pecten maximus TaxID=6579 RepID=UPI00145835A6|nr:uncharacterized protein LOC117343099 [Pecten maximus]